MSIFLAEAHTAYLIPYIYINGRHYGRTVIILLPLIIPFLWINLIAGMGFRARTTPARS